MEKHNRIYFAVKEIIGEDSIDGQISKVVFDIFPLTENEITLKYIGSKIAVSNATINRYCHRLKLNGFKDLKTLILLEQAIYRKTFIESKYSSDVKTELTNVVEKTYEANYAKFNALKTKLPSKPYYTIQILATPYYSHISKMASDLLIKDGHSVIVYDNPSLWDQSIKHDSDITIFISFTGDRIEFNKILIEKSQTKDNILLWLSSIINVNLKNKDNFIELFGKNEKDSFPQYAVISSLVVVLNLLNNILKKE